MTIYPKRYFRKYYSKRFFSFGLIGNTALLFSLLFLVIGNLNAQDNLPVNNAKLLGQFKELARFEFWNESEGGKAHDVPFVITAEEGVWLESRFEISKTAIAKDSLYLYLHRIGWHASLYLNDRLLKVIDDPYGEYLLKLAPDCFNIMDNKFSLKLESKGLNYKLYPTPWCGILYPPVLLARDSISRISFQPKVVEEADSVIMIAAWSGTKGMLEDTTLFYQYLKEIQAFGYHTLYFPYEPYGSYLARAAEMGFSRVHQIDSSTVVAFFNNYPSDNTQKVFKPLYWYSRTGRRTPDYQSFQHSASAVAGFAGKLDRYGLIFLLFIPFLGMALLKFLGPRVFEGLTEYLTKGKIYLELINKTKFLGFYQSVLMNFLRILIAASSLSIFIYFLQETGRSESLNLVGREGLLAEYMNARTFGLIQWFGWIGLFLSSIQIVKYLTAYFFGFAYRLPLLSIQIQNLDVFSAFPQNLLPLIPAAFVFFVNGPWVGILFVSFQLCLLLAFSRRVISLAVGLIKLYDFPLILIFLYICTLEILPWVFLL